MTDFIFKSKDFVIVDKPVGIPVQADSSGDKDLLTLSSEALADLNEPCTLWLVHRLDRVVGGLTVFARNKRTAAALSELFADGGVQKRYLAVVEGAPEGGRFKHYLYKNALISKALVSAQARRGYKEAELVYSVLEARDTECGKRALVELELLTGRYHQIRAQFSYEKMPLVGDKKYGSRDTQTRTPSLYAYKLAFTVFGKSYEFKSLPPINTYPWDLFDPQSFEL